MDSNPKKKVNNNRRIYAFWAGYILLITILLISCNNKTTHNHPQPSASQSKEVPVVHSYANTFYTVYELSANTTAAVINLGESEKSTLFDSIFQSFHFTDSLEYDLRGPIKNCTLSDTAGPFYLMRNPELENKLMQHIPKRLFIHGTKGSAQVSIEQVLFAIDPCITNFLAFCFDKKEVTSVGQPLIASTQLLQMEFGESFDGIEKEINRFYSEIEADYKDNLSTAVFARSDSLYFAYSDDFSWNNKNVSETCLFPMRSVFIAQKNQQIMPYWSDGLDLFGIPCD